MSNKNEIIRLKKVKGQIEGIIKMIEADICSSDILDQLTAAHSAIASARAKFLEYNLTCIIEEALKNNNPDFQSKEIKKLIDKLKKF
jgi:DNA-binding FrmR family transcriptional regulator